MDQNFDNHHSPAAQCMGLIAHPGQIAAISVDYQASKDIL